MALEIRKIGTKEEAERKSKRNTLILSIVMITILVFSTAGYFSMRENSSGSADSGKELGLSSPLESTKNVSVIMFKSLENYAGKTVYVASEYDSGLYEINSALQDYAERIQPACYGMCNKNLPEKDCNDTLIVISRLNESEGEKGKVYEQDNCVFIEGNLDAVDAFLYHLLGVN